MCANHHLQLLLLRVRSLHFCQLVFYLLECGPRVESPAKLVLHDAAFLGDGAWVNIRGLDQRCAYTMVRQARGAMFICICGHRTSCAFYRCWGTVGERSIGEPRVCRWGRHVVPVTEFLLVCQRDIGQRSAGALSGTMNMGGQFGGVVTASLTPAIANHFGWSGSFLVAAVLCAAGALAWLPVRPARDHEGLPGDSAVGF